MDTMVPTFVDVFTGFDFYVVSLGIFVAISVFKQLVKYRKQGAQALNTRWAKLLLNLAPVIMGPLFSIIPGIFSEYEIGVRIILGCVAGFFSDKLVYRILSIVFPAATVSGDDESRRQ